MICYNLCLLIAQRFNQLGKDIQQFLEQPTAVYDLFSKSEVKALMYNLSAKEITIKLCMKML